jgi:hypothetical protein
MQFIKRLRGPIARGEITTSIRIWQRLHVRVGGRYVLEGSFVVVDTIREITFEDITAKVARDSGLAGVADLLKTAKRGPGNVCICLVFTTNHPPSR